MINTNKNSSLEIESFMKQNSFKLKLSLSQSPNLLIKNEIKEPKETKEKNEFKFISKKRGRRSKLSELDGEEKNATGDKNLHDKFRHDNIRRKIKASFHKYLISTLNNLMEINFKNNTMKFLKMNIRITKDVGIEYNRELFEKNIKDIIIKISKKYKNKDNYNKSCIEYIKKQKNNEEIIKILNTKYKDLYSNYYLKSTKNDISNNSYEDHKEKLLKKYGEKYLSLFIKNAENFIEFYLNGKNRKLRKGIEVESISIPFEKEVEEEIKQNEFNGFVDKDNIENYFFRKNMVSSSIQTDIFDINKKIIAFA